jgi:hypothetical protein
LRQIEILNLATELKNYRIRITIKPYRTVTHTIGKVIVRP